jgi:hypothetical protein
MLSVAIFMAAKAGESGSGQSPFVSTLVGAVVGGAVSLGTTLLVERQRSKNAQKADVHRDEITTRLAARLIALELSEIESVLHVVLKQTPFEWPPTPDFHFRTAAWETHAADLAKTLSGADWQVVALPYSSFQYANLSSGVLTQEAARTVLAETEYALTVLRSTSEKSEAAEDSNAAA